MNQKISPPTGTYSQPSIPIQATSGASPASRWAAAPPTTGPAAVETPSGVLVHRVCKLFVAIDVMANRNLGQVVPDDNSCLFSSVALIFEQDIAKAQKMRQSEFDVSLCTLFADLCGKKQSWQMEYGEIRRLTTMQSWGMLTDDHSTTNADQLA